MKSLVAIRGFKSQQAIQCRSARFWPLVAVPNIHVDLSIRSTRCGFQCGNRKRSISQRFRSWPPVWRKINRSISQQFTHAASVAQNKSLHIAAISLMAASVAQNKSLRFAALSLDAARIARLKCLCTVTSFPSIHYMYSCRLEFPIVRGKVLIGVYF